MNDTTKIRKELLALSDNKYKEFSKALIPGCDNLIGVRIPQLRIIAKELSKQDITSYLNSNDELYFEEIMLKGLVIGYLKTDIDLVLFQVKQFIPKITNWSLCDSFSSNLKIVRKHPELFFDFIQPYLCSKSTYEVRFAIALLLFHYVNDTYINKILVICDQVKHDDYYVKMVVAWCLQVCYVKFPELTMQYLINNNLDDFTYNKALQKIRESRRVSIEDKVILQSMKRK